MAYISPIKVDFIDEIVETIQKDQETAVMKRVKMVVDVDEEELLKALRYDRNQYEKGYEDGRKAVIKFIEEWQDQQTGGEYSYELITDLLEALAKQRGEK